MRILLRPFLCQNETRRQSFTCMPFLPIAPHIVLVTSFRSFTNLKPHPSQMRLVRLIVFARKNRKLLEDSEEILLYCSQSSCIKFQQSCSHHPVCVPWAFAEHWPYLAMPSKPWVREKVSPVESGLTRLVATALIILCS